jgi:ferredoxin
VTALIYFTSEDLEVEVDEGIALVDVAAEVDCDITFGCKSGSCGTCRVRVVSGMDNLSAASTEEKDFLDGFGAHPDERLGCQLKINGDCKIRYVGLDDLPDDLPEDLEPRG